MIAANERIIKLVESVTPINTYIPEQRAKIRYVIDEDGYGNAEVVEEKGKVLESEHNLFVRAVILPVVRFLEAMDKRLFKSLMAAEAKLNKPENLPPERVLDGRENHLPVLLSKPEEKYRR